MKLANDLEVTKYEYKTLLIKKLDDAILLADAGVSSWQHVKDLLEVIENLED